MKNQIQRFVLSLCALLGLSILFAPPAYAYIDPATTSYLIQLVAGLFITCGVVVGVFWKKIRLFFRGKQMNAMEKRLEREADKKNG